MTLRLWFRWLQTGFLVLGLLLVGLWLKLTFESRQFQAVESNKLAAALLAAASRRLDVVSSHAASFGPPAPGALEPPAVGEGVLGRIEIPRLHITAIVAEGSDAKTLRHAVGHITSTALPGDPGNCALAGHRDTFLRGLGRVRVNDVIRIVTLGGTYTYRVEWSEVVEPQRVDVLDSTAARSLTLVTCYPFVFVGHAPRRFITRARQLVTVARSADVPEAPALRQRRGRTGDDKASTRFPPMAPRRSSIAANRMA